MPFRLGCSVAALVFTPVPQHPHSLIGSPDLQGLLLENGAWCWPSYQLPREALRGVNLTGSGKAQTPPKPRMPHRSGARVAGNCSRAWELSTLLLLHGRALTFAKWMLQPWMLRS